MKIQYVMFFGFLISSIQAGEFKSILHDKNINHGFRVLNPSYDQVPVKGEFKEVNGQLCQVYRHVANGKNHHLYFGNIDTTNRKLSSQPKWSVAQWDSMSNLYDRHGDYINEKTFQWENWYKKLILGKPGGGHKFLTLAVNGSREYRGEWPSQNNDPCLETRHPHLTLSQTPKKHDFSSINQLKLKMSARKRKSYLYQGFESEWDKNQSTAHFVIQINLQHIRKDKNFALGHGDAFGLGINLYDVRNRPSDYREWQFIHKPQKRLITYINPNTLGDPNLTTKLDQDDRWIKIDRDILPEIKKAFANAIREGKKNNSLVNELYSEVLGDYSITSIVFGWEVSSLHDVEMQIPEFDLQVK